MNVDVDWKQLIGFKSEEDLRREFEQEFFSEENRKEIKVTNWRSGGVLKTITYLFIRAIAQIYILLLNVLPLGFIQFARGRWLDLKVAELNVQRFQLSRTQGKLICLRDDVSTTYTIKKGTIVKTSSELKYLILEDVIFEQNQSMAEAKIIAENPGSIYNVAPNTINLMTVHNQGITIYNPENWITAEGSEEEDDDSLRERYFLKLAEITHGGNTLAYESWARSVPGITGVWVDQFHPRGQGTVDVWISTSEGDVSLDLIDQVKTKIDEKKPPTANVEVYAATLVLNHWEISVMTNRDSELVKAEVREIVGEFYYGSEDLGPIQQGQTIYVAQVEARLMIKLGLVSAKINVPMDDLRVEMKQKNALGSINVQVERVS